MDMNGVLHAFHFLRPVWLLALIPLLGIAAWLAWRRARDGNWSRLIDPELLPELRLPGSGIAGASTSPWPWLALVWLLAVLALAGPTWKKDISTSYRAAAAWVLVLDLSPSMNATDLAPNRITRARYAIEDLLGAARDARVGLVAFSDEPYTVTPLTEDVATIRALLPPLAPDIMPTVGDNLAPALAQAGQLLKQAGAKDERVIVLTGGFADPAAAFAAAAQLGSRGIVVDVIGVGAQNGTTVHSAADNAPTPRLDSDRLHQLAAAGHGDYVDLANLSSFTGELQKPEDRTSGAVATQDIQVDHWREEGIWLLPGLLLLAAALSRRGWL